MIYAVQYLFRQTVSPGTPYVFTLEDQLDVQAIMDPTFRFYNPTTGASPTAAVKITSTVALSGTFSDTYTVLDTTVIPDALVTHEFQQPIVQGSLTTHVITYTNNDSVDKALYGILTGWTDVKTVLSNYIGTKQP